jgi:hypothetical protein
MELYPIIELSVIVFGPFAIIVISSSFISYKLRKKIKPQDRLIEMTPVHLQPAVQIIPETHYQVQHEQIEYRRETQMKMQAVPVRPIERFQVLNQQQLEIRSIMADENTPFYHPRAVENQRQFADRKAFSLFDNYSNSGERLHKLNLSTFVM